MKLINQLAKETETHQESVFTDEQVLVEPVAERTKDWVHN
jgi:hypothetical protein